MAPFHASIFPEGWLWEDRGKMQTRPRYLDAHRARRARQRPGQGRRGALHAATWKTVAISNVAVAFRKTLGSDAPVPPIQIERHGETTPPVLYGLRVLVVSLYGV